VFVGSIFSLRELFLPGKAKVELPRMPILGETVLSIDMLPVYLSSLVSAKYCGENISTRKLPYPDGRLKGPS
jgi:hypothetical protein